MEMSYTVKNAENDDLLATGSTEHCFLNKSFRPVRLKKNFTDIYSRLLEIAAENQS